MRIVICGGESSAADFSSSSAASHFCALAPIASQQWKAARSSAVTVLEQHRDDGPSRTAAAASPARSSIAFPALVIRHQCHSQTFEIYRRPHADGHANNGAAVTAPSRSCFDVILPAYSGSALFRDFVFAGARAIGLQELEYIQLASGRLSFPRDYPDLSSWSTALRNGIRDRNCVGGFNQYDRAYAMQTKRLLAIDWTDFGMTRSDGNQSVTSDGGESVDAHDDVQGPVIVRTLDFVKTFIPPKRRLSSPSAASLPFATLMTLRLVPVSKGVPRPGARLFKLEQSDYVAYWLHRNNRRTERCGGNALVGHWSGLSLNDKASSIPREQVGFVSSGGATPHCARWGSVAVGHCNAAQLIHMFEFAHPPAADDDRTREIGTTAGGGGGASSSTRPTVHWQQRVPLLLFLNEGSKVLRPAHVSFYL